MEQPGVVGLKIYLVLGQNLDHFVLVFDDGVQPRIFPRSEVSTKLCVVSRQHLHMVNCGVDKLQATPCSLTSGGLVARCYILLLVFQIINRD